MDNRYILSFFLFLGAGVHASETDTMTQIGENVMQIGSNLCTLGEKAAGIAGDATLFATKITAGLTSVVARFPRLTLAATVAGGLYASWRAYNYYRIKHHLDNAKAFLYRDEPRSEIPTVPHGVLTVRGLNVRNITTRAEVDNYLGRITELKANLGGDSLFDDWKPAIARHLGIATFDISVDLTPEQIGLVDQYINSRVESLGSPQYYGLLESPFVWYNRLASPWRENSPINPLRSYASAIFCTYQGEATKLTWELFKWEKALNARWAELPQA